MRTFVFMNLLYRSTVAMLIESKPLVRNKKYKHIYVKHIINTLRILMENYCECYISVDEP